MNCEECKKNKAEKEPASVPFRVYETAIATAERNFKRLWAIIIILILLFVGSNIAWLIYESQFETVESTTQEVWQETEDGGNNNFVGGDYNGSSKG